MDIFKEFYGPNAGYVLELYDRYLNDPSSLDPETREAFRNWKPNQEQTGILSTKSSQMPQGNWETILSVARIAQDIRQFGHLAANSGNNALSRDPRFTPDFLRRHQDKLVFGSDCSCAAGVWEPRETAGTLALWALSALGTS